MIQEVIIAGMAIILTILALNKMSQHANVSPNEPIYFQGRVRVTDLGDIRITIKNLDGFHSAKDVIAQEKIKSD